MYRMVRRGTARQGEERNGLWASKSDRRERIKSLRFLPLPNVARTSPMLVAVQGDVALMRVSRRQGWDWSTNAQERSPFYRKNTQRAYAVPTFSNSRD